MKRIKSIGNIIIGVVCKPLQLLNSPHCLHHRLRQPMWKQLKKLKNNRNKIIIVECNRFKHSKLEGNNDGVYDGKLERYNDEVYDGELEGK